TAGSAGMDLCTTSKSILTPENSPLLIPTGVYGPLPPNTFGLILGRASTALHGIQITPGVLDNDFKGEIKIIAATSSNIASIPPGTRIAQLVILPLQHINSNFKKTQRPTEGPGSSDIFWAQPISHNRPTLKLKLNGKLFEGILDTGADSTVISSNHWPKSWPLTAAATYLQGIEATNPLQSSQALKWEDEEGNAGTVIPYIIPHLPVNLWGRDILTQMKVFMCSPSDIVTAQMLKMNFLPGKGLGKANQGIRQPISITPNIARTG
ncbi:endogenous retrovirus group K member 113 Pro protein-like, partial [Choloepus didactylus]|uniref:endogenous retrovirus group K member 113 Pro protein-like n=1 Tax=Choloepus didactylus TaxID=27675 RepID=UPI00189DB39F